MPRKKPTKKSIKLWKLALERELAKMFYGNKKTKRVTYGVIHD